MKRTTQMMAEGGPREDDDDLDGLDEGDLDALEDEDEDDDEEDDDD